MKVRELMNELAKVDPEKEVCVGHYEQNFIHPRDDDGEMIDDGEAKTTWKGRDHEWSNPLVRISMIQHGGAVCLWTINTFYDLDCDEQLEADEFPLTWIGWISEGLPEARAQVAQAEVPPPSGDVANSIMKMKLGG